MLVMKNRNMTIMTILIILLKIMILLMNRRILPRMTLMKIMVKIMIL